MTTRTPIGTIASTLILSGLALGVILVLVVSGGVFRVGVVRGGGGASRSPAVAAAAATVATTMAATTMPSTDGAASRVSIDNFSYAPTELTVAAGTKVTWVNHDDVPHTVTADDKSFNSGALDTDDVFARVFDKPGAYPYFCGLHPHMTGRVIVK